MTLARRIAALETSLTPTQLVLRWLDEAHRYGTLEASAAALLDAPLDDMPLNRLCREAEESARGSVASRSREEVDRAVRKALREAVFRFFLVLRANVTTREALEKETYIQAAMSSFVAMLVAPDERGPDYDSLLGQVCTLQLSRVADLESRAEARMRAARRYLDGRELLFPDLAAAWDEQLTQTRECTAMAVRLAELDGVSLTVAGRDDVELRVEGSLADLVEPAKVMALDKLGEGEPALRLARAWLRPKLGQVAANAPFALPVDAPL